MDWIDYYQKIAGTVALKSKDPSTKVGAILVSYSNHVLSTGYNGFPVGVDDLPTRLKGARKYQYMVHAEQNAIAFAARYGISTHGSKLFVVGTPNPIAICSTCAKLVVQAGVQEVVSVPPSDSPERWLEDTLLAQVILREAGVRYVEIPTR